MSPAVVLVDTSAWVEFLNRPGGLHHEAVARLLEADRVAITGVVAAELLRGCRTPDDADELDECLSGVMRIEVTYQDWCEVGREMGTLRAKGISVSLSDAAIAHAARRSAALLYTLDADFRRWPGLPRFEPHAAR